MPTKGGKVATRQARLKKRRRRGQGAGQDFQAGPVERVKTPEEEEAEAAVALAAPARPSSIMGPSPDRPRRTRQAASAEPVAVQKYMGAELRRIGAVALVIFALLAAASFILG
jgi:hypothetical protein